MNDNRIVIFWLNYPFNLMQFNAGFAKRLLLKDEAQHYCTWQSTCILQEISKRSQELQEPIG